MATYLIEWKTSALQELKRLDRKSVPRIVSAAEALSENPFPHGVRKLSGAESTYRIRVGYYRIVYTLQRESLRIEIIRVRHRKDVYR